MAIDGQLDLGERSIGVKSRGSKFLEVDKRGKESVELVVVSTKIFEPVETSNMDKESGGGSDIGQEQRTYVNAEIMVIDVELSPKKNVSEADLYNGTYSNFVLVLEEPPNDARSPHVLESVVTSIGDPDAFKELEQLPSSNGSAKLKNGITDNQTNATSGQSEMKQSTSSNEIPHIVTRCINPLATKACADPNLFGWPMSAQSSMKISDSNILWNGISTAEKPKTIESDWWYEESSSLCLPLYKRLILSMEFKGMKPEYIAGSLIFYSKKYLRGLSRNSSFHDGTSRVNPVPPVSAISESEQRVLMEEIVGLLPTEGLISKTFIL